MKKREYILLVIVLVFGVGFSQAPIKRKPKKEKIEQISVSETQRKHESEARRKADSQRRREDDIRRRDAEAKRLRDVEVQSRRDAEERQQKEVLAKQQMEEAQRQHEAEAKRQQEEDVRKYIGTINGHGYVDLGLPSGLKWATCNVGAMSPDECGYYYEWGETEKEIEFYTAQDKAKKISNMDNRRAALKKGKSALLRLGIINSSDNLTSSYDTARAEWGGSWRMPTKNEFQELFDNCKFTWTIKDDRKGYEVTGPNGQSIFLVYADKWSTSGSFDDEGCQDYWSSTFYEEKSDWDFSDSICFSWRLGITAWIDDDIVTYGLTLSEDSCLAGGLVRPVSE